MPGVDDIVLLNTDPGKAFRNFTCMGSVPGTYSEYMSRVSDVAGLWWADLFYDANGFPTYNMVFQDPYDDYKQYPRTVVTYKEFVEIPSPTGAAPWARYKVMSDTGAVKLAYVERFNTVGGNAPGSCGDKFEVSVPYTADYRFYWCREGAVFASPSPAPAGSPPPTVAAVPPKQPTPIVTPSPMAMPPTITPNATSPPQVTPSPTPSPTESSPSPSSSSPSPSDPSVTPSTAGAVTSTVTVSSVALALFIIALVA